MNKAHVLSTSRLSVEELSIIEQMAEMKDWPVAGITARLIRLGLRSPEMAADVAAAIDFLDDELDRNAGITPEVQG